MKKLSKFSQMLCGFAAVASMSAYSADIDKSLADLLKDIKNPRMNPSKVAVKVANLQRDLAKESGSVQQKANLVLAEVYFHLGNYSKAKACFENVEKGGTSYKRLLMMLGAVLGDSDAKPMLTEFFQSESKPLVPGDQEKELFEKAARRYIEFLLPDKFNEARRVLEMVAELCADDKEAYKTAKRQLVLEIAKMRNDVLEQQKRDGKKLDKSELEKMKKEIDPLRDIVDGPLTQLYIEALRRAIILEDQAAFNSFLKQAIFYAFEFNYNMENQAASIVRARRQGAKMSRNERIKMEKELLSEFSPYGGMYYYYAINNQLQGDKALKNGNKANAEKYYSEALKSLMVVNTTYLLSPYNDKGMKVFEDISKVMDEKLGKKVKYEYQVRDYYTSLLVEISSLMKIKDYKAIEPFVLRAMRRSRSNPASMMKMADILVKLCWANLPSREYHTIALAMGLNETYPGFKPTEENVSSPESLLSDAINLLLKNVTLQTPDGLKYASIACNMYVQIATDQEKALTTSLRVADASYNLAFEKQKKAAKEKSAVLAEQSKADFKVAAETYEQIITRWPDHPLVSGAYYRTGYAYRNAGLPLKSTQFFMGYAKRESDQAKAQNRIDALMLAGSALLHSKDKGAGAQCRDVFQLLYDIASKPMPGIEPKKAKENKELATLFLAYGFEAAGNEAQRSYEDGRFRVKEINSEIQQIKAMANASVAGVRNFEKQKVEILDDLNSRKIFFKGDFESSLQDMLERLRKKEMNGAETVSAESEAKIKAKLEEASRHFRKDYKQSRQNELKLIRRDWDEELNELKHFVLGQRGIVRGLLDERRATSGSLDSEMSTRTALTKKIKDEEKDINSVKKELTRMSKKLETLRKDREKLLNAGKSVSDIDYEISTTEGEINDFQRATSSTLSPKRLERLDLMKKKVEQLNISISASESLITPLITKLNRESAKLDYQEKRINMIEKAIIYARVAEQKDPQDPMVKKNGQTVIDILDELITATDKWITLEVNFLNQQREEGIVKGEALKKESEECIQSFASAQTIEQAEKKKALNWFEKYLALNPNDPKNLPGALAKAAFMSVETKDYAKVETYLAKLVKEFPNSELAKQAQFTLGRSYAEQGKIAEASKAFGNVIRESGKDLPISQLNYIIDTLSQSTTKDLLVKLDILDRVTTLALSKNGEKNMDYICQTALLACAQTAFEANEINRSVDYSKKLLLSFKRGHATVDAHKLLVACYQKQGTRDEVLEAYDNLLANRYLTGQERILLRYDLAQYCEKGGGKESLQSALDNYAIIKLSWLPTTDLTGDDLKERLALDPVFENTWHKYVQLNGRFGRTEVAKKAVEEYKANYPQGKFISIIEDVPSPDPALIDVETN